MDDNGHHMKTAFDIHNIKNKKDMRRTVFALAWPVVLQNFFWTLMFFADTAMVGRLGEVALSAVGIAGPLLWSTSVVVMAVGIGTMATVARAIGEGNRPKAQVNAATGLLLALVGGAILTAVIFIFAEPLIRIFMERPDVVLECRFYFRTIVVAFVFSFLGMIASSVLRAAGDTRTPMIVTIATNILNIVGNYVLIFGKFGFPEMGVLGAGIATAIARIAEGLLLMMHVCSSRSAVYIRLRSFLQISKESIWRVVRISLPAAAEPLGVHTGFLAFMAIVARLGTTSYAAHRVAIAVESLGFMMAEAYVAVTAALVGQSLGAKRKELAEMATRESMKVGFFLMSIVGLVFLFLPGHLARIVTDDRALIEFAALCLMIGAAEQPLMVISGVFKGAFQGAGDTKTPAIVGAISVWIIRVPAAYFFAIIMGWGLTGIWVTTVLDWAIRSVIYFFIYRRGKWKHTKV
jgi:putative MATE family efflux protein